MTVDCGTCEWCWGMRGDDCDCADLMAERLNWTDKELREEQRAMQSYVEHWEQEAIE